MQIRVDDLNFGIITVIDESGNFLEYNLPQELAINERNLKTEMLEQPSKYVYWSSILEKIKHFQEAKELELEILIANLDKRAREELKQVETKPTKDMVESHIKRQPEYETARKQCQQYDYLVGRVTRIVKAFEQRKDMLQSYGKQVAEDKFYGGGAGTHLDDQVMPNPNYNR